MKHELKPEADRFFSLPGVLGQDEAKRLLPSPSGYQTPDEGTPALSSNRESGKVLELGSGDTELTL